MGRLVVAGSVEPDLRPRRGRRSDRDVIPRRGVTDAPEPDSPPAVALGAAAFVSLYLHYVLVMGGN